MSAATASDLITQEWLASNGIEAKQLHGDLYRVKLNSINYTDKDNTEFFNPRHSGNVTAGLSSDEMAELREDIKRSGLNNPLLVRPCEVDGKYVLQLVNGERRKRSLDYLVKKNEECYDSSTGEKRPAKELYEYVDVRIRRMSDQEAFRQAISSNATAIDIGEGGLINFVRILREKGHDDEFIIDVTGRSTSWIRQTDQLLQLDDKTFSALCNDEINRDLALQLSNLEVEERLERLDQCIEVAKERLSAIKEQHKKEESKDKSMLSKAKAKLAAAEGLGGDVDKANLNLEETQEKIKKRQSRRQRAEKVKGRATAKDAEDLGPKPLSKAKLQKLWYTPCEGLVKTKGKDEEGNEIEGIDLEDVRLVLLLEGKRNDGEEDIMKVLKKHFKDKARRAK